MAKSNIYQTLQVNLPGRSYPIIIGQQLLNENDIIGNHVTSKQVLVVTNNVVAPFYLHKVQKIFSTKQCDTVILKDGEEHKNSTSLFQIYTTLIEKKHHRDTTIVALGGGVVGDISGFAAATYQRGVNFVQIPTTLLAQVDASVGGKTAINHAQAKNMIGSFYQPKAVVMDLETLKTLPDREFQAGFAEIIKYAILNGGDFLLQVQYLLQDGLEKNTYQLAEIISRCCQIKATFVQEDEFEQGSRALLNLGHTVAHALEAYTEYKRWLHGEAVGIGLYYAALLSYKRYGLSLQVLEQIDNLLALAKLPRRIPNDINLSRLRDLMNKDKKIKNNSLRFVLINSMGKCYLEENVTDADLQAVLQSAVEE